MTVKPATSIENKQEIKFPKRDSSYYIGTAGQKAFGRGDTVQRAHLSEAAFYEDLEKIRGGIEEAAEYGQVDIETTTNGRNEIYDLWQKAKAGMSSYTPIFIPWFIDQEYSADNMTSEEKKGLSRSVMEMLSIPDAEFIAGISPEEKEFVVRVASEWNIVITAGQLKWRRYKIWDKGEMFWQEYPEDDVSCFLQSGRTVFAHVITSPGRRIPLNDLRFWKATEKEKLDLKKRRLYAGVDGAEGTPTGDRHCFAVIDIVNGKAVVIFEITSNDPIDIFWAKVSKICKEYNILLGIEKNGVGVAHCQTARRLGVKFIEWETNAATRPTMITSLEEAYRKEDLIETYPEAENELRDMEYGETKTSAFAYRAEAKKGKHDDRAFARMIAWQIRTKPAPGVIFV